MKQHFLDETPVEDFLHKRLLDLYHLYLIVGGMPEAVVRHTESKNIQAVRTIQDNTIYLYRNDI